MLPLLALTHRALKIGSWLWYTLYKRVNLRISGMSWNSLDHRINALHLPRKGNLCGEGHPNIDQGHIKHVILEISVILQDIVGVNNKKWYKRIKLEKWEFLVNTRLKSIWTCILHFLMNKHFVHIMILLSNSKLLVKTCCIEERL